MRLHARAGHCQYRRPQRQRSCKALIKAHTLDAPFRDFNRAINQAEVTPRTGKIIGASATAAARQHNCDGEDAAIKAGYTARDKWADTPAKAAQTDTKARDCRKPVDLAIPIFGSRPVTANKSPLDWGNTLPNRS